MANQTLTDVTRNYDDSAISGLLNGETITLNNSTLNINSDSRWGQQAAVMGSITTSSTLGGVVNINATQTKWVKFDSSTGNVPALGVVGVNDVTGSISGVGEFLGVWTALGVAPLAVGVAMPASGFIKLRSSSVAFVENEVMTFTGGATVTIDGTPQVGWIHVVGAEATTMTIPRLGKLTSLGDWFQLGTTNGLDDQTFTFPVADNCPAIQVETSPGSNEYEWWLNSGNRWATATQFVSTDERGKYFGMNNATGIITIAQRASNACGFKPVAGLKVRIPNIIISSSISPFTANTISATLATRYDLTTTSAGEVDLQHVSGSWFLSCVSAYSVMIKNSALLNISLSNLASKAFIEDCAFGIEAGLNLQQINATSLFSGIEMKRIRACRVNSTAINGANVLLTDAVDVLLEDAQFESFGALATVDRGTSTNKTIFLTRCTNVVLRRVSCINGFVEISSSFDVYCYDTKFAEKLNGTTTTTLAIYVYVVNSSSNNIVLDGYSPLYPSIANLHPYLGFVSLINVNNVEILNFGSVLNKIDSGSSSPAGVLLNASISTNITIRRCYFNLFRLGVFTLNNTVQNILIENVWGAGVTPQVISSVNSSVKGCRWTYVTTPQTAVYARHWEDAFVSTTGGRILIAMNEPLATTVDQVQITSGTPAFTSGGQISMRSVGDQAVFTTPYFILGYTSLANLAPIITGTLTSNMTYEYQIDTGSGFSVYKALTGANLSTEAITSTSGFRLKVRVTTTIANSTNVLSYIAIQGVTNAVEQEIQYPLPFDAQALATNITPGSRIQVYNVTTLTEIKNEIVPGSSFSYGYYNGVGVTAGDVLRIRLSYINGLTAKLPQEIIVIASTVGYSVLASQTDDEIYISNAIDGSLVTELDTDYLDVEIDSNDVDGETNVQRIYAWFVYTTYSTGGIAQFFNAILAEDAVNYRINTSLVDLKLDNIISTPLMIIGGRMYRDDGATVIAATSNSIQLDPDKAYAIDVSVGSGPSISDIADGVWDSLASSHVVSDSMGVLVKNIDIEVLKRLKKNDFIALK